MCVCIFHLFQIILCTVWRRENLLDLDSESLVLLLENTSDLGQGLILGAVGVTKGLLSGPGPGLDLEDVPDQGEVQEAVKLLWRKQSFYWKLM